MPQNTSSIADTRKGLPPFINFEEHLNAMNGQFTIPALNFSLNSPASMLLDRPAPGTPAPSAQNQFAVEGTLGRQAPSTLPSPTPTLVAEPDTSTGLRSVPHTSRDVLPTPRPASGNTRTPQFPIDSQPCKLLLSSRKSNQGNNVHDVSARVNPFAQPAQSYSADTSVLESRPMAPPVRPSRSDKATRTFSESDFDPRPAKRLKISQPNQARNRVSRAIQHI
jgi:hypothetical protein